jgi:hypothetical protein
VQRRCTLLHHLALHMAHNLTWFGDETPSVVPLEKAPGVGKAGPVNQYGKRANAHVATAMWANEVHLRKLGGLQDLLLWRLMSGRARKEPDPPRSAAIHRRGSGRARGTLAQLRRRVNCRLPPFPPLPPSLLERTFLLYNSGGHHRAAPPPIKVAALGKCPSRVAALRNPQSIII